MGGFRRARVRLEEEPHKPFEGDCTVKGGWLHCRVEKRINTASPEFEEMADGSVRPVPRFELRHENRSWPTDQVRSIDWLEEVAA
jgi:hypothetical protein